MGADAKGHGQGASPQEEHRDHGGGPLRARFEAWARLVPAYNIATRTVMASGLTEAGAKALEGVVWEGYNGWHDSIAERMTTKNLRDLDESDGYDRAIVLEFASWRKGEHALQRLEKILDRFEHSLHTV